MAKITLTKELSDTIKELRIANKIKAIDLADHVEKSPAYISKLESGTIKTIEYDELLSIISFISNSPNDLSKIIEDLSLEIDPEVIDEQIWFQNFDTIERRLPVPKSLVDYINQKINELNISVPYLVNYVNKNEDLEDLDINEEDYEKNLWYTLERNGHFLTFIYMKLAIEEIEQLLNGETDTTNYVTIRSLIYNLFRLEHGTLLSDEENAEIKSRTRKLLNEHKFYSATEKSKLLAASKDNEQFYSLLNEFDNKNRSLINEMLMYFVLLSNWNIKYTNERLALLNKNLKWDSSYILTMSSLPFYDLNTVSKDIKSSLLDDIKNLITKYKDMPETKKTIESYDN